LTGGRAWSRFVPMSTKPSADDRRPEDRNVEPKPPRGWTRKLLLVFPIALFIFLVAVMIWGILDDLLSGY
jgi:hypothetical protein